MNKKLLGLPAQTHELVKTWYKNEDKASLDYRAPASAMKHTIQSWADMGHKALEGKFPLIDLSRAIGERIRQSTRHGGEERGLFGAMAFARMHYMRHLILARELYGDDDEALLRFLASNQLPSALIEQAKMRLYFEQKFLSSLSTRESLSIDVPVPRTSISYLKFCKGYFVIGDHGFPEIEERLFDSLKGWSVNMGPVPAPVIRPAGCPGIRHRMPDCNGDVVSGFCYETHDFVRSNWNLALPSDEEMGMILHMCHGHV